MGSHLLATHFASLNLMSHCGSFPIFVTQTSTSWHGNTYVVFKFCVGIGVSALVVWYWFRFWGWIGDPSLNKHPSSCLCLHICVFYLYSSVDTIVIIGIRVCWHINSFDFYIMIYEIMTRQVCASPNMILMVWYVLIHSN